LSDIVLIYVCYKTSKFSAMIPKEFSEYFTQSDQVLQQQIIDELLRLTMQNDHMKETSDAISIKCPHCQSKSVRGNGKANGMQRYVCKDCKKNFSYSTGKFFYALKKKDRIHKYLFCLLSGYSIRRSAEETEISIQTSFDWRHKLLTSFAAVLPDGFKGIVESKDVAFLYSEKGRRKKKTQAEKLESDITKPPTEKDKVAVIATCDRMGNKDLKVVAKGKISKSDVVRVFDGKLNRAEVLCSKNHRSYTAFTKAANVTHKKYNPSSGQRKAERIYHVQNVQNMNLRLQLFMQRFNGVATKYLQNYMNWFLILEKIKYNTRKMTIAANIALNSDRAWYDHKQQLYNTFYRT